MGDRRKSSLPSSFLPSLPTTLSHQFQEEIAHLLTCSWMLELSPLALLSMKTNSCSCKSFLPWLRRPQGVAGVLEWNMGCGLARPLECPVHSFSLSIHFLSTRLFYRCSGREVETETDSETSCFCLQQHKTLPLVEIQVVSFLRKVWPQALFFMDLEDI